MASVPAFAAPSTRKVGVTGMVAAGGREAAGAASRSDMPIHTPCRHAMRQIAAHHGLAKVSVLGRRQGKEAACAKAIKDRLHALLHGLPRRAADSLRRKRRLVRIID